jgi:uncharacterized protein (DUF433 family)
MTQPDASPELPDFLFRTDSGSRRFVGHRIDLYHVVTLYQDGYTADMIADHLPTLPLAVIHKAIAYYLENRSDVETYVRGTRAEIERQMALPQYGPSREELLRRWNARPRAESA